MSNETMQHETEYNYDGRVRLPAGTSEIERHRVAATIAAAVITNSAISDPQRAVQLFEKTLRWIIVAPER